MAHRKQMEETSHKAPVLVAMLPQQNPAARGQAVKMGFAVHLPTPIDPIEMISTIASLVGQAASERSQ
jgi:CheY-like chemotaxis protein